MNLTALDRRVSAKGATDGFAQRLGAVDDEQPVDLGIEPALDQIVDQRLHDGGVLGCSLDQTERMLVAFTVDTQRGNQHQVVADMQAVDLDDQEVQFGQVRCHPLGQPFGRQRHEPARGRRLRGAVFGGQRGLQRGYAASW